MGVRLEIEVRDEDRKRRWEDSLSEVNLWNSLPEMGANLCDSERGWGDSVFVVGGGIQGVGEGVS